MSTKRKAYNLLLPIVVYAAAGLTVLLLVGVIGYVLVKGLPNVSISLLTSVPSVIRNVKGILPYILNTLYVVLLSVAIVLPLGVGAAVYLNEYAKSHKLIALIEYTTETLAGIPSIIYGLVGMLVFNQKLGLGGCLISGSLTLVIMVLPTIIRTTQESLKTVPQSYREGALGLGATKWHRCCPAAWMALSPAAFWPSAASWARARLCCSPPAPARCWPAASPMPTPPAARPFPLRCT